MKKIVVFAVLFVCLASFSKKIMFSSSLPEVKIGKQVWTKQNLDLAVFRNGDPIKEAKTSAEWVEAYKNKVPAWCYYDNNPENGKKYGKLYNWFAVTDARMLAPAGWHIPTEGEWNTLMSSFKNVEYVGTLLKDKEGWNRDGNGTNESGFSGLPGGYRYYHGGFASLNSQAYWWSSTEVKANVAVCRSLSSADGEFYFSEDDKGQGFSVRCLKD